MSEQTTKEIEIREETGALERQVNHLEVFDPASYEFAGSLAADIGAHIKKVKEWFSPMVKKAHEAHKAIKQKENEVLAPAEKANKLLRSNMQVYLQKVEEERKEAQRKLEVVAAAKAEAERRALLKREDAAKKEGTKERLREEAAKVEASPAEAIPEVKKTTRTETATISQTKDLELKITYLNLFLTEVISGKVPISIIGVDMVALKRFLKATNITNGMIKGLEIKEVVKPIIRGRTPNE